jgi:signal transduction histidine kinase
MGELARKRARSWLVATTLALLLVSILVIVFMLWVLLDVRQEGVYVISSEVLLTLTRFDLLVSSLLAVTIVVLGRAVVAYEIFTGKTLPRRGLWRQWALAVLLSAGYGLVVGWALTAGLRPVYGVLLSAVMMTLFFALLNWRSYADRERYIEHLQPFVASQGLYNQMLQQQVKEPNSIDAKGPFRALCRDVLGSEVGYLLAYGPLELLVDSPLVYPDYQEVSISNLGELIALIKSPQTRSLPVDPLEFSGATWAVPLWSERGLVGIFLLGKKKDGSLYTQEEIEIARASGERLIDIQASSEMSRRLLILQRQRMAETQIVDRKTRLHLHDEVLPQVHTAMLSLSNKTKTDNGATEEVLHLLSDVHRQISDILRELPSSAVSEIDRLGVLIALRRVIENEFGQVFDSVSWNVNEFCEQKARTIPPLIAEVLYYATREAIRNAARHGRPLDSGKDLDLCITADWGPDALEILVEDNGVGLASTTTGEKWGGGLSLHGTMMVVIGGSLTMESLPNAYTRAIISLPHNTWEV